MPLWSFYLSMTLTWAPVPALELEGGPAVYQEIDTRYAEFEPLTLTWSPEDGFGASTKMTAGRTHIVQQ